MGLNELKNTIKVGLETALIELSLFDPSIEIELEIPKDTTNGDFSSNVAMKYARIARKAPFMIADDIVVILNQHKVLQKAV